MSPEGPCEGRSASREDVTVESEVRVMSLLGSPGTSGSWKGPGNMSPESRRSSPAHTLTSAPETRLGLRSSRRTIRVHRSRCLVDFYSCSRKSTQGWLRGFTQRPHPGRSGVSAVQAGCPWWARRGGVGGSVLLAPHHGVCAAQDGGGPLLRPRGARALRKGGPVPAGKA